MVISIVKLQTLHIYTRKSQTCGSGGTYYGPSIGYGVTDYNGTDLYIVGNGGIGGVSSSCFNPMPLNKGPVPGTSYFLSTVGPSAGSPFIGEFGLNPIVVASVKNSSIPNDDINVFPNPTSGSITVSMELENKQDVTFTLYDVLGQVIYTSDLKNQAGTINKPISLSLLSNGVYLLQVKVGNNVYERKVIKQY